MCANKNDTTVVLTYPTQGLPLISYWGPAIPNKSGIHTETQTQYQNQPQLLGAGLETPETPSLLPTQAEAWTGTPFFSASRKSIEIYPKFRVETTEKTTTEITINATDTEANLQLKIALKLHAGGLLSQQATLTNTGDTLDLNRLWLHFPCPPSVKEILTHTGHHMRERAAQRQPLTDGFFAKESWTGRPDFHTSLLMVAGTNGFNYETGRCYSAHIGWSGNQTHFVTRTPYSQPLIGGGELLQNGEITLKTGESYTTPVLYGSWGDGLNQLSHRYHNFLRATHGRPLTRKRPITLNIWEAVYFDQNERKLHELAEVAAKIGVERFVVDDGWFKGRRNDTKALGDWQIDTQIWPNGLKPLADYVHSLGMEFGLWFEPEMISLDSDLARAHPDWILRPNPTRLPLAGRDQYVLDLANPAAAEYIYRSISKLVAENSIDYVKWDHNRFVTEAISTHTGRPAIHAQVVALYDLLDRLHAAHPDLEIESCASGGGRVDLGILTRTQRIWTSDCTDPLERIDIQAGTSLLVPPEMMGAHVASSPSHITRRQTSVNTRVAAAFLEHFGVEWNLLDISEGVQSQLKSWINVLNQWRDLEGTGYLYHGTVNDPALRLDGLVAADGSRGVYRFACLQTSGRYPFDPVQLPGLEPSGIYQVELLGPANLLAEMGNPMVRLDSGCWWNKPGVEPAENGYTPVVVTGAAVKEWGLRLPALAPETVILIGVVRVD